MIVPEQKDKYLNFSEEPFCVILLIFFQDFLKKLSKLLTFLFNFFKSLFISEREGDTEYKAGFRLPAFSPQPRVGLELSNHLEIRTWAQVRRLTLNALSHPGAPKLLTFKLKSFLHTPYNQERNSLQFVWSDIFFFLTSLYAWHLTRVFFLCLFWCWTLIFKYSLKFSCPLWKCNSHGKGVEDIFSYSI